MILIDIDMVEDITTREEINGDIEEIIIIEVEDIMQKIIIEVIGKISYKSFFDLTILIIYKFHKYLNIGKQITLKFI